MDSGQFERALCQLADTRRRLRELLEWEALFREQPKIRREPGFDPSTLELRAVQTDLRNAYGFFLSLASDLSEAIDAVASEGAMEHEQCERWNRRLMRIWQEVGQMRLGERLIKA
jgi:hypothetical protein